MRATKTSMALATLAAVVASTGCNFAPHYEPPKTVPVETFKEAVPGSGPIQGWKPADPKDAAIRDAWWEVYEDAELNDLESRVAISNQTVAAAEANYRVARAMMQEAEAALFPSISLDPAVTRSRPSAADVLSGSANSSAGATTTTVGSTTTAVAGNTTTSRTIYSLPLEASYQVDVWGSVRNSVAQSRYAAQASAAQIATALLSTQSQLAQDYFQLRVADEQRRLLDTTLADYQASLRLVTTLFKGGLASDEDLATANTQLESAKAQATDLGIARAQYEHAIAVLIGVPPANFSLVYRHFNQSLPTVPVGVPSDLLERRPDIATAERQVAASNAGIGIARAAYFPTLTLSGSAGFESTSLSQLFDWPNRFWAFGPTLAQMVFDGGLHRAQNAQARALSDQAVANYRQTVLTAMQSVEDNLVSLRVLSQELGEEHGAALAAQRTVTLSITRYRNGIDSYVNVIAAQNAFLTAREAELQVQLRQLTASVNLINNLGGGWSTSEREHTERTAQNPPGVGKDAQVPAENAGAGIPNPPPLPNRELRPDELLNENAEDMSPALPGTKPDGSAP
jgi:NodT family efflux transporter outer membrane factor (OMF) lipoprotein